MDLVDSKEVFAVDRFADVLTMDTALDEKNKKTSSRRAPLRDN
jgi:hypothetical protein